MTVTVYLLVLFYQNPKDNFRINEVTGASYVTKFECETSRARFPGLDVRCIGIDRLPQYRELPFKMKGAF